MAVFLLLLVSSGVLFFSSNAQGAYEKLPENYKEGVDLALEKLDSHAGIQHHFLFFRSITKSDISVQYVLTLSVLCSLFSSVIYCGSSRESLIYKECTECIGEHTLGLFKIARS